MSYATDSESGKTSADGTCYGWGRFKRAFLELYSILHKVNGRISAGLAFRQGRLIPRLSMYRRP